MNSIGWRLAGRAARLLDAEERDAALGDLAESGESGVGALRNVLGLVARRQVRALGDWRAWFVLAAVALPMGAVLTMISRRVAGGTTTYLILSVDYWSPMFLTKETLRHDFLRMTADAFSSYLMLGGWAWIGGFIIGALARHAALLNAAIFLVVCIATELSLIGPFSHFSPLSPVFDSLLFQILLPIGAQAALVLLPAGMGMRHGLRITERSRSNWRSKILRTAAGLAILAYGLETWFWVMRHRPAAWTRMWDHFPLGLILRWAAILWPLIYFAVNASVYRRESRPTEQHT